MTDKFWKIFYNYNLVNKLKSGFTNTQNSHSKNCVCECHKNISEYETDDEECYSNEDCCYESRCYVEAFIDIMKIIEKCKNFDGYVFLDIGIVAHNINTPKSHHSYIFGDEQHYNKELIILLKEPNEILSYDSICTKFHKIINTLNDLSEYHFDRRSYFFEGIAIIDTAKYIEFYNEYVKKNINLEKDSYTNSLIGMMQKMNKHYKERDKYSEYSSDMFYDFLIKKNKSKCKIYEVSWGS